MGLLNNNQKPGRQFPSVGTGALVFHNDHLLMVCRQGATGAGTWSVPGGWVDKGEHPWRGAEREVLEETGIVVKAVQSMGWTNEFHPEEKIHAITLWVLCEYISGKPIVVEPQMCPKVAWIPISKVDTLPLFQPLARAWPFSKDVSAP